MYPGTAVRIGTKVKKKAWQNRDDTTANRDYWDLTVISRKLGVIGTTPNLFYHKPELHRGQNGNIENIACDTKLKHLWDAYYRLSYIV